MKNWNKVFKKGTPDELNENVFKLIGQEWFLISAGTKESFNMMTASWGGLGIFWNKPMATCFIRPTRHTYNFIKESDVYTICFLGEENKDIHKICGSKSGRDIDKAKETGLTPVITENGSIAYEQARLVIECKKMYFNDLTPVYFVPDEIDDTYYPNKDYHRMYIGEILNIYKK